MKKHLINLIIVIASGICLSACYTNSSKATSQDLYYFALLDSTISQSANNLGRFENRIAELQQKCNSAQNIDEVYFYQRLLSETYMEWNADSALIYIDRNLELARREARQDWEAESYIIQAQTNNSAGLLDKTRAALDKAHRFSMKKEMRLNYLIGEMTYWNNRAIQLNMPTPDPHSTIYADSIMRLEPSAESPYHMYAKAWYITDPQAKNTLQQELMSYSDAMNPDDIWYDKLTECTGMIAYVNGDIANEIKYYSLSLVCKFNRTSRHLPQLTTIGSLARDLGELTYAAHFYNTAIEIQTDHPEHVYNGRAGMGNSIMQFHNAATQRLEEEVVMNKWLTICATSFMVLSLILLVYTIIQLRKRILLNRELAIRHQELATSEQKLREANDGLTVKDKELQEANSQLLEANYLKEEYIGQLFFTCSEYLNKVEVLKKSVNRKLRAGQYAEATKQTDIADAKENAELHELWNKFDEVFLKLFPDFIKQFNGLLRPEERITLRSGEKMNTDLRIYALVRLGINNSVKIAKILGISNQTVYNARLKMRARATESELEFPVRVRGLKGTKLFTEKSDLAEALP